MGREFGYMTAIRETGGLLLILLMALLYRVSLQWVTAGAMLLIAVGYGFTGVADSFATVVPWILIGSFGMHTILQTQYSLGMTLTTQDKVGHVLGRLTAFGQAGTFAGLLVVVSHLPLRALVLRAHLHGGRNLRAHRAPWP